MTKSAALLSSVALLSLVAASGGCGSSQAGSAPSDGTGATVGVGANGTGADGSTGTAGTGAGSTEPNPSGSTTTQGSGGDPGSIGGSPAETGATGTGAVGTGADGSGATGVGGSGAENVGGAPYGGSITIDVTGGLPSSGGLGTSIDVTGGSGTSIDITGGSGTSIDITGGTGTSIDLTGGTGTSIDLTGGTGTTVDLTGGRGTNIDLFGGTGNTSDMTGGVGTPPPPPKDAGTPGCVPTWFAKQINVLVLNDANVSNADTRGAMWVGGDLTGVGYDVGGNLPPNPTCTRYDLAVGGNATLSGWLVLHNGAAAYGGTLSVTGVQGGTCGVYHNPADMPNFTQIAADVKENSAYFANLPANGTVSGTTFNSPASGCKIVVFNTTLCSFAGVTINIPKDGTAIINSSCTNPTFTNGQTSVIMGGVAQPQCNGQQGTGGACNHILYNFPNATTVTVSGMSAQGSILAPYAKFLGNGGNVAGEVVVDSMDTGVEFHAWFFEGCLDTTTC